MNVLVPHSGGLYRRRNKWSAPYVDSDVRLLLLSQPGRYE
jgi:hypothetical protein